MKQRLAIAAATSVMVLMMSPSALSADAQIASGGARLRAGPDTEFRVIAGVPAGMIVRVRGCPGDGGWCRVKVFGRQGWIAASRLAIAYTGRPGDEDRVIVDDGERRDYVRILGKVVDRPGYCYALAYSGNSIIVRCP